MVYPVFPHVVSLNPHNNLPKVYHPHFMDKEVEVSRSCLIQVSGSLSGKFGTQML